jgi:hypothetical protein
MSCSCTAASTGKDAIITLLATYDDVADSALTFFMPFAEIGVQDGAFTRDFELPIKLQEGTDIKVRAVVGNDNSICIVSLRGWIE